MKAPLDPALPLPQPGGGGGALTVLYIEPNSEAYSEDWPEKGGGGQTLQI